MYEGFLLSYRNKNNTNLVTEDMPIIDHTVDEQLEIMVSKKSGRQSFTKKGGRDANALGLTNSSSQPKLYVHGQQRKSSVSATFTIKELSPQGLNDRTCSDGIEIAPSGLAHSVSEAIVESMYIPSDLTRSIPKGEEDRKSFTQGGNAVASSLRVINGMKQRKGSIVSPDNEKPWAINMIEADAGLRQWSIETSSPNLEKIDDGGSFLLPPLLLLKLRVFSCQSSSSKTLATR
jgi:hypothetical protein